MKKTILIINIISIFIGAIAGYAYWKYVGCASGGCPITSNPYISTIYGAVFGWLVGSMISNNKKSKENDTKN